MAADSRIAERYAKSIISLAQEKGSLEALKEDMELIKNTCDESRELRLALKNPIIKSDRKYKIFTSLFSDKVQQMTSRFSEIICSKGRGNLLYEIVSEVLLQYNTLKGILGATVTTAFALTDDLRGEFRRVLKEVTGKEVVLAEQINESLIGGYILTVGDKQVDASIESRLKELKVAFAK